MSPLHTTHTHTHTNQLAPSKRHQQQDPNGGNRSGDYTLYHVPAGPVSPPPATLAHATAALSPGCAQIAALLKRDSPPLSPLSSNLVSVVHRLEDSQRSFEQMQRDLAAACAREQASVVRVGDLERQCALLQDRLKEERAESVCVW